MIVVDASAILEVLLRTPAAAETERRLFDGGATLHAPHLIDIEVAQVLRRYYLAGEISAERGQEALDDLADMPLSRYPHRLFLSRIWGLRDSVTGYDAVYIALAETLPAPLVTRDERLRTAPGHCATVEVL